MGGGEGGEKMGPKKSELTGEDRGARHVEGGKGGERKNGIRGGRNGPMVQDFRVREEHWVAGQRHKVRDALEWVMWAGGRGRCPGGQSNRSQKRGG